LKLLVCVAWVKHLPNGLFQVGAELVAVDPVHKRKMLGHLNKLIQGLNSGDAGKGVGRKSKAKKKATKKKTTKKASKKVAKKSAPKKTSKKKARRS